NKDEHEQKQRHKSSHPPLDQDRTEAFHRRIYWPDYPLQSDIAVRQKLTQHFVMPRLSLGGMLDGAPVMSRIALSPALPRGLLRYKKKASRPRGTLEIAPRSDPSGRKRLLYWAGRILAQTNNKPPAGGE